jgi:hypothetical protein
MSEGEKSTSTGTVIGFGFILLGVLNLFASGMYQKTSFSSASKLPGLLFIAIGVTMVIIKMIKKTRE